VNASADKKSLSVGDVVRTAIGTVVLLLLTAGIWFFVSGAEWFDKRENTTVAEGPYTISPGAKALHEKLFVADLHSDLLLWNREPLIKGEWGHTDIPRLIEGNVALQVFSTVSHIPRELSPDKNSATSLDLISVLALAERRPRDNWTSELARAKWTAQKLHDAADRSGGRIMVVTNTGELERALEMRSAVKETVLAILSIEGMQVLEGKLENLKTLYAEGFRMGGIAHFYDNEVGGSAHGEAKGGLTPLGREVVKKMEEKGMIVDLAHASPKVIDDVLAMATKPVVVSHGGSAAICPSVRTLTDDQLKRIAANGGVVGIGFWPTAVCDSTPAGIAKSIRHAADVMGIDHVALGSDWDGTVRAAFAADGMGLMTEALMKANFTEDEIAKVMGGNVLRLLQQTLPGAKSAAKADSSASGAAPSGATRSTAGPLPPA
jgi:microsomal dipeptidase-like Zn-dependent dipeptidase